LSWQITRSRASPKSANIVLDILYRAAQVANLSYDGKSRILGELKGKSAWAATLQELQMCSMSLAIKIS
jgi:hypothetical protein